MVSSKRLLFTTAYQSHGRWIQGAVTRPAHCATVPLRTITAEEIWLGVIRHDFQFMNYPSSCSGKTSRKPWQTTGLPQPGRVLDSWYNRCTCR